MNVDKVVLLLPCHGCGTPHEHEPAQMFIDPSLTILYRCPQLDEVFYLEVSAAHAAIALNNGVPLQGVPDTIESLWP